MGKIKKRLCDLNKNDIEKHEEEILAEVRQPKYICEKCIRVATHKKLLCKAKKIDKS